MTDFSGRLIQYGIAAETARGTAVAPQFWVQWETASFEDEGKNVLDQSALNVLNKYSGTEVVEQTSAGNLAGRVTDRSFGLILLAAFGGYSVADASGETTVYTHTFTESQLNASPTLTVTRVDPNIQNQYAMTMLNSLELDIKAGDYVRWNAAFVGQPSSVVTGVTPDPVVENDFVSRNATVKFNNGSAIAVQSLKLTYSKNVSPYFVIGKNNPDNIYADSVELKGEFVLRYSDETYKNYRFNNTPVAIEIDVSDTATTLGSASHPGFTITLPLAYCNEWKADQSIDGMVNQTVGFEAVYNLATNTAVSVTLTNTHTSYSPAGTN